MRRFWAHAILAGLAAAVLPAVAGGVLSQPGTGTVSFKNDVMAVLSKAGCNAGSCHGNANGKGGFKISLRGENPEADYLALTHEQFGRRVNPLSPEESLVLLKPTVSVAHEGGKRFAPASGEYEILRRWIADGATNDCPSAPDLVSLEVTPRDALIAPPTKEFPISVKARFSSGEVRDVSRQAVYETSNPLVTVSPEGTVRRESFGESTVLVRYLNNQVAVTVAMIPDRKEITWPRVRPANYVDEQVFAKLKRLKTPPSEICSDSVFLRRAYLDLTGALPSPGKAREFVNNRDSNKRARLVNELLGSPGYADFWTLKWSDLLKNEARTLDAKGVENFHHWIRQSIATNKPLDQFVRELVSARGSTYQNPAANYYRANRDPVARAVSTAQLFLGTRLQCAQCHSHPFDRWTQDDYYGWAAAFAKIDYKVMENRRRDSNDSHEFKGEQVVFTARKGEVKNPRTGKKADPRFLGAPPSGGGSADDPVAFANWLTSPSNPYFARVQVNRIWFHLMGRGLVDPIDDFRATNPASHPALLDKLASDFVSHQFDVRHVIRMIMNSRTYQMSSEPTELNKDDEMNYSHNLLRRLTAEQLLDCQSQVTGTPLSLKGMPAGTRAVQMPGANYERRRGERISASDQFLELFGKPQRLLTCECERSSETTMSQAFQLISGPSVNELIAAPENRVAKIALELLPLDTGIEELYWAALTRSPTREEALAHREYVAKSAVKRAALDDITWALLNSKEFLLRR